MTQQSYPNNSEEVAVSGASSSTNSASTSSTDVYPLPFSIGQKEIVLNNDERSLVAEVPANDFLAAGTNVCVTNSSNVDVGHRTTFNEPVTIYQYIQGSRLAEIQDGAIGHDEVECNKNVTLISMEVKNTSTKNCERLANRRKIFWISTGVAFSTFLIIVILLNTVLPYKNDNPEPTQTPTTELTTTPIPGSDADVFVPKEKWGGIEPVNTTMIPAATLVVVKHTGGPNCTDIKECRARVREIQKEHMEVYGFPDISYNFLIGGDGKVYIGRGFHVQNEGRNDSMDIAFIGNFTISTPTPMMNQMGLRLIIKAASPNTHAVDYVTYFVVNHNQTERTESPGANLFKAVTKWRNYSTKIYFNDSDSNKDSY